MTTQEVISKFFDERFKMVTTAVSQYEEGLVDGPEARRRILLAVAHIGNVCREIDTGEKYHERIRKLINEAK